MNITRRILTEMQDFSFLVDDGGILGAQTNGNRIRSLRSSTETWYYKLTLPTYKLNKHTICKAWNLCYKKVDFTSSTGYSLFCTFF
jgi:hypothetical protein